MSDMVSLYSEIWREMQGLTKALALISKAPSQRLKEEWNRTSETMKIMGISSRTLARLMRTGKLPSSKVNGILYIKTSDIERLLNNNYKN